MLGTGLLLVTMAIFIHYSETQKGAEESLNLLLEEKLLEQDEAGKVITLSMNDNSTDSVKVKDDSIVGTSLEEVQMNNTDEEENSTEVPMNSNNSMEETEITNQSSKININTATSEQLQQLKGIGPSKAKAIIEDREQKGLFKNIADIKRVKGIGEKLYAGIQESIVAKP